MLVSKNESLLPLALGFEDGEEFDLVDGQEIDIPEDQDLENRELMSEIVASEDYYSHYNPYANAIHNATQLFLTSHNSFESFVNELSNEDYMQSFKNTNAYDMIVASAIDNVGTMMVNYPISIEDYGLNHLVGHIALEDYTVSFEGAAGAATTSIIARLANLGSAGWSRIKSWGEAIAAGYKALKAAIAKKDWAIVRLIKGFLTRTKRYAKSGAKFVMTPIPGTRANKLKKAKALQATKRWDRNVKKLNEGYARNEKIMKDIEKNIEEIHNPSTYKALRNKAPVKKQPVSKKLTGKTTSASEPVKTTKVVKQETKKHTPVTKLKTDTVDVKKSVNKVEGNSKSGNKGNLGKYLRALKVNRGDNKFFKAKKDMINSTMNEAAKARQNVLSQTRKAI